jgi:phosphoribosylanthranilate isomerase
MPVTVKICGLTSADAVDATVRAGALYGGLVFHAKSPRFVPLEQARGLADRMRGRLKIVALIADMDDAGIEAIVKSVRRNPQPLRCRRHQGAAGGGSVRPRCRRGV